MKHICLTYILITVFVSINPLFADDSNKKYIKVSGNITDASTKEPLSFASLYIHELYSGAASDINGRYSLLCEPGESYRLTVTSLGYQTVDTVLSLQEDTKINFSLKPRSFALEEVVVSAKENTNENTSSVIGKEALQHIQPSSLADVLQLLPGGLTKEVTMTTPKYMQLRQAGSDVNTSLGTAFVIDGVTLNNDAAQNVYAPTSDPTIAYGGTPKPTVAYGADLRSISTDRIESIEIVRGIPSVEYGNLTSGLVKIALKRGKTPLEGRVKTDLNNKLFAIGKGFLLPGDAGTLNIDLDYTNYKDDPRKELSSYTRFTTSGRYQNRFSLSEDVHFKLEADMHYTGSFDKKKSDPDAMKGKDDYDYNDYNNFSLSSAGTLTMPQKILKELYYNVSASYARTLMDRKHLITPGVMPLPSAINEGEYEAQYLPAQYSSLLKVDGQPFNLTTIIRGKTSATTGTIHHLFTAGAEWRYNKNFGKGEIYDLNRPPYPATKSTRPRPYVDIPAIHNVGLYIEDRLKYNIGKSSLTVTAGLRATPFMLPQEYAVSGKWYIEPRFNAKLDLPDFQAYGEKVRIALTAGVGRHYRFPTQAQLYPAPLYFDYLQLNYYALNPDLRLLNVRTWIEDPTNYHLQPALNSKYETGIQIKTGKISLDVTVFNERLNNGFSGESTFVSHTYRKYDPTSVDPSTITQKPDLRDFTFTNDTISSLYSMAQNNSYVNKRGVEYTLHLGKIDALYTSVRLNGAWFLTEYKLNALRYFKPSAVINGRTYPYVGIYNYHDTENRTRSQFNTNLDFDTHIPKLRMIFTSSFQAVWFTKTQEPWNNGLPVGYLDDAGRYYTFEAEQANNPIMKHLTDSYMSHYFDPTIVPLALNVYLKMSKEIGDFMQIGFYVNRIFNYLPSYKDKYGRTVSSQTRGSSNGYPFFGAEISIKI
ncbi:TonB-dependent receptor [Proteiniphilum sp.]|nr:carboxypeptidase-like regulatory domain-containing protein [Proteiniphilum sp.]MEA4916143.1 carboxypeptidase-like regulatory domain-containing protein [Proteiniphilum sp.]